MLKFDFQYILPIVSLVTTLFIYSFIIAKRYQKILYSASFETTMQHKEQILDLSETMWWELTMVIAFLGLLGFILMVSNQQLIISQVKLSEALLITLVIWSIIAFIGFKITRSSRT